ncbi:MAG: hypothetical protein AAF460_04415, partial [Pseudomonadota bacterium]
HGALRELADEMSNVATTVNDHKLACFAAAFGGIAATDPTHGLSQVERAIEIYDALHENHFTPYWQLFKAELHSRLAQHQDVLHAVEQGLSAGRVHSNTHLDAELLRLKGCALARSTSGVVASTPVFNRALQLSRKQGARLFTLRILRDRLVYAKDPTSVMQAELRSAWQASVRRGKHVEHADIGKLVW